MNVSAILYLMNHEQYGRSTASAQYFLQLAGYLGIPVRIYSFNLYLINSTTIYAFSLFFSFRYPIKRSK